MYDPKSAHAEEFIDHREILDSLAYADAHKKDIDLEAFDNGISDDVFAKIVACNVCPEKRIMVTEGCQGCLEHPCMEVCPRGAIRMEYVTLDRGTPVFPGAGTEEISGKRKYGNPRLQKSGAYPCQF